MMQLQAQLPAECAWLDAGETNTLHQLSASCGMPQADLEELVDYCALIPLEITISQPMQEDRLFSAQWVLPLREVGQLRADFDLDLFTVALLLGKMSRIELLKRELRLIKAQLSV
jgi:chaperone modulatory protein CbpM